MDKKYKYLKSKVDDFFCIDNLRTIYDNDEYNIQISFIDFLMCIEDFYTFVYSPILSKNAWLLFTWFRTLVRYDGYVQLSYKDVSNKFNNGSKSVISSPTFFKCVTELESYGLVRRVSNKRLFDTKYQKDTNTYIVISKVNEVIPLLDGMKAQSDFYSILRFNFFNGNKLEKLENPEIRRINKTEYNYSYDEIMSEYKNIETEIKDFFAFLGSSNKTGKISSTRRLKILNIIREIFPSDNDLVYAISQTISKGIKSEKYLFAILKNIYNQHNDKNIKESDIQKKYKTKVKSSKTTNTISDSVFKMLSNELISTRDGYKSVLQKLKSYGIIDGYGNTNEQKLLNACNKRKRKEEILKESSYMRAKRMRILEKYDIYECFEMSKTFSEVIWWERGDEDNPDIVPFSEIREIANKHKNAFCFNGAQIIKYD